MFQRIMRFRDPHGDVHVGELGDNVLESHEDYVGLEVEVYADGVQPWDEGFKLKGRKAVIQQVLCPLASVPQYLCVGLNYYHHAKEANIEIPEYPLIFAKPPDARAGPFEDIPIPAEARNLDYEAELCVVIGRDVKDPDENASLNPYICGFSAGNDVSSRWWQDPTRCGSQHAYAKSFDSFAPFGPVIVSQEEFGDYQHLEMTTKVNGELRQETKLGDMIFSVEQTIRHLARGRTLRAGTVVMMGTPSGVAAFMKPEPTWLTSGDCVEISVEKIGTIKNRFV